MLPRQRGDLPRWLCLAALMWAFSSVAFAAEQVVPAHAETVTKNRSFACMIGFRFR